MNTYHHLYSDDPNGGGEGTAILERSDLRIGQLKEESMTSVPSFEACGLEEVVVIEGKLEVSF